MSYISLSTNLVAKSDIQVDGTKVADIFDLPKFEAKILPLEERKVYIRRVFTFQKFTFCVKRRGGVKPPILLKSHSIPIKHTHSHNLNHHYYSISVDALVDSAYYIVGDVSCKYSDVY